MLEHNFFSTRYSIHVTQKYCLTKKLDGEMKKKLRI